MPLPERIKTDKKEDRKKKDTLRRHNSLIQALSKRTKHQVLSDLTIQSAYTSLIRKQKNSLQKCSLDDYAAIEKHLVRYEHTKE